MAKSRKKVSTRKGGKAKRTRLKSRAATGRSKRAKSARPASAPKSRKKKAAVARKTRPVKAPPKRAASAKRSTAASRAYALPPKFVDSGEDLELPVEDGGVPAPIPPVGT